MFTLQMKCPWMYMYVWCTGMYMYVSSARENVYTIYWVLASKTESKQSMFYLLRKMIVIKFN